jgi:hypothetical protein
MARSKLYIVKNTKSRLPIFFVGEPAPPKISLNFTKAMHEAIADRMKKYNWPSKEYAINTIIDEWLENETIESDLPLPVTVTIKRKDTT